MTVMLDTNILAYHLTHHHAEYGDAYTRLFERVTAGLDAV